MSLNTVGKEIVKNNEDLTESFVQYLFNSKIIQKDFYTHCESIQLNEANKGISIVIHTARCNVCFLWFIHFLVELDVLARVQSPNYHVNGNWHDAFLKFMGSCTREKSTLPRFSLEDLKRKIERNENNGLRAELFVLSYEKKRLARNPFVESIKHVAKINVGAGYDILSFHLYKDLLPNRFIEVKSWVKEELFYFSLGEHEKAKKEKDNYYLYVVDRNKLNVKDYEPTIIKNPCSEIFKSQSEWEVTADGHEVRRINQ